MNIVVDVESDGPIVSKNSMVCFGAVCVEDFNKTFYGKTAPISKWYVPDALRISGFSRKEHEKFDNPLYVMQNFYTWLKSFNSRVYFWSDNVAYDWQWINFYLLTYCGENPFGYSGRRIGDLYAGLKGDVWDQSSWKKERITKHDHNPVNDAMGNAEVLKDLLYPKDKRS